MLDDTAPGMHVGDGAGSWFGTVLRFGAVYGVDVKYGYRHVRLHPLARELDGAEHPPACTRPVV